MSFLSDCPDYLTYSSNDGLYYSSIPIHSDFRGGFESLLMEVGEYNSDSYPHVLSSISRMAMNGILHNFNEAEIYNLVSKLFRIANNGKFDVFMDCLSVIHDEGGVSIDSINCFLEENKIGYYATPKGFAGVKWNALIIDTQKEDNDPSNGYGENITRGVLMKKGRKIFITHSSADKKMVLCLTELLRGLKIPDNQIICTTDYRHRPDNGVDAYKWLKEQFNNFDLHMIFVLSDAYFNSAICLNEMGAAWLVGCRTDILLLPGFDFKKLKSQNSCLNTNIQSCSFEKSDNEIKDWLNKLRDDLEAELGLSEINPLDWESIRNKFITDIRYNSSN